jgi:hypothetical protein
MDEEYILLLSREKKRILLDLRIHQDPKESKKILKDPKESKRIQEDPKGAKRIHRIRQDTQDSKIQDPLFPPQVLLQFSSEFYSIINFISHPLDYL